MKITISPPPPGVAGIPAEHYETTLDKSGKPNGFRLKNYTPTVDPLRPITRWTRDKSEEGSVSYTAIPRGLSKDSGVSMTLTFQSKAEMDLLLPSLTKGHDDCPIALAVKRTEPGEHFEIIGVRQGVRLRAEGEEVFAEAVLADGTSRRILARPSIFTSDQVRYPKRPDRAREGWETRAGSFVETTFARFIDQRERLRAQEESSIIPNRSDHIIRSIPSTSSRGNIEEETRKLLAESGIRWEPGEPFKQGDKHFQKSSKTLVLDPARAMEICVGLTPNARRFAANLSSGKKAKRKTSVHIAAPMELILPFDESPITIEPNADPVQARENALAAIEKATIESIYRALDEKTLKILLGIFSLAYERDGVFLLDQKGKAILAAKLGIDLPRLKYSGAQYRDLEETLEELALFDFVLTIRQPKTGAIFRQGAILHHTLTETAVDAAGKIVGQMKSFRVNTEILRWLQMKRQVALIDNAFFQLDAKKETWEIRLLPTISSRWSKGWLGSEKLSKKDGIFETTVGRLLTDSGLALAAESLVSHDGAPELRRKVRSVFENLRRCGPNRVEAIADFEILESEEDSPLEDRIRITPSAGQVDRFRDRHLGRAESKMLQDEKKKVEGKRPRGRPRKTVKA
jgi:hypothetical protein